MSLTIVMFLCGVFGGLTAYLSRFCREDKTGDKKILSIELFKEIFYGIIAAFIVPLFLNTINSDLVNKVWDEDKNIFIFSGFCLLFSLNAKLFIEKMTNKTLGEIEKNASEANKNASEAKEKASEANKKASEANKKADALIVPNTDVSNNEDEILKKNISNSSEWTSNAENIIIFELGKGSLFKTVDILLNKVGKFIYYTPDSLQKILDQMEKDKLISDIDMLINRGEKTYALTINGKIKFKTLVNAITWEITKIKNISLGYSGKVYMIEVMNNGCVHELQLKETKDSEISLEVGDKIKVKTSDGNIILENSIQILNKTQLNGTSILNIPQ